MTMLLLDKVMYVQSAQQGDKFVKYDLDDPNNPLGPTFTQAAPAVWSRRTGAREASRRRRACRRLLRCGPLHA